MSETERDFDVAVWLVSCARRCVEEPLIYAPLRMVDAVSRLAVGVADEFLLEAKTQIDREKWKVIDDREGFIVWLDELARCFAAEAKRRNLTATGTLDRNAENPDAQSDGPEQA
jgi:hypothetical protein